MKSKELIRHELIGLNINVLESKNKANVGIRGKIIDETRNTLIIQPERGGKIRLFKNNIIINVQVGQQSLRIDGKSLCGRPKERIK